MTPFVFQLNEVFPILSKVPVVEAVLEIRARADENWSERHICDALERQLPNLPVSSSVGMVSGQIEFPQGEDPRAHTKSMGWHGIEKKSVDGKEVVRFEADAFNYNHLTPYPGWQAFIQSAMDTWRIHQGLASITAIQRIGLRFINKISVPVAGLQLEDYFSSPPLEPKGLILPFSGFLHRDNMVVPGTEYAVQIIRTLAPPPPEGSTEIQLILDIDVSSTMPWSGDTESLMKRLSEMRWLKNKAFFGSLGEKALQLLTSP